jgi:phage-related protein
MADGIISIDVELNEKEFEASLANMGELVKTGSEIMIKSIDDLGQNFALLPVNIDTAFKAVPGLINGLINNIASNNPVMAKTGSDLFNSLVDNISEVASNISDKLPEINDGIITKLTGFFPAIGRTGRSLFGSLTDNLPEAISAINDEVPQIALEISEQLDGNRELIVQSGFGLFTSLIDDLPSAINIIGQAPNEIVENILEGFTGLLFKFNEIGISIVHGVWAGISSMGAWLSSQVNNFFQNIVSSVTGFLGINSPSTLFRDKIGRNIALGVGEGIAAEMPGVARDMLGYVNGIIENAELSGFSDYAITQGYNAGVKNKNFRDFKDNIGDTGFVADVPAVNITIEPSGDIRGFFEYLSMNIKRVDYLGGGENL